MDNHNKAKVHLYGTVELMMSSGKKLVLINVLYVPDMKKNLVSTNLLGKSGLKNFLKSSKLILSTCGIFVGRGYVINEM